MKNIDYKSIFSILPERYVVFDVTKPGFRMIAANEHYFSVTNKPESEIIGKGLFEVFPDTSDLAKKTGKG